jgi:hypothetical protein
VYTYESSIQRVANGDAGHLPYILPSYVREGAIIPTRNIELWVGQNAVNPLAVHAYPLSAGLTTEYSVWLDDGVSRDSAPSKLAQFVTTPRLGARDLYKEWKFTQTSDSSGKVCLLTHHPMV